MVDEDCDGTGDCEGEFWSDIARFHWSVSWTVRNRGLFWCVLWVGLL